MNNPKFSFFLRNKPNTENLFPIVLTITMGKDRTQVFTGQYVAQSKWNAKTKRVKGHDQETKTINDTLVAIATQARQVSNELLISGMPFNPNTIKEKIKYGFKKNLGVVEAYEIFLERMKRLIPSRYTKATLLKYTNTKERVREFIKHYTRRNDIYLYELDTQFMEDFDTWIRNTYKVNHNTVYKTYQRFTRFLRQEIARGNLERYPFVDYKIKMEVKEGRYLTFQDIQSLENLELDLPKLIQTRSIFLLSVYCGMAFIDLYNLKENDLFQDEDGMLWFKTYRQKSKSRVSVPLISNAIKHIKILRSGEFDIKPGKLLPIKSNVHLNYEIKQIASAAKIKEPDTITFHCARRSTSSIMMKAGIPLQILQKVLSHRSLSTSIQFYTHTDDEMVKKAMIELDERLESLNVPPKEK
ncbi:tyrosine-type recombinase/integrase [Aquirufa antheringensis]|uniref:tyrosine-type recombinase/integrase n=1 Tax=Aquirufa antheringensis TaxID=2516559 RepID=UPI0022A8C8FD|nr:site-specific integrase [Aquirufa antheringensis]MCZ2488340.1 site-specific integrase [Aquirufa antheringensis]